MSHELPDRRSRFFGREEDVAALLARVAKPGLTAVVGRPQIGKSWLLNEVARRLASNEPRRLVGIAESKGETRTKFPAMGEGRCGWRSAIIVESRAQFASAGVEREKLVR